MLCIPDIEEIGWARDRLVIRTATYEESGLGKYWGEKILN